MQFRKGIQIAALLSALSHMGAAAPAPAPAGVEARGAGYGYTSPTTYNATTTTPTYGAPTPVADYPKEEYDPKYPNGKPSSTYVKGDKPTYPAGYPETCDEYGVAWGPKHPKPSSVGYPKGGDYDPKYPNGKPTSTYVKGDKPTYPAGYPETCDEYGVPWGPTHPKPSYPKGGDYDPKYPHGKPSSVGYPKDTKPTYPAGYPETCDEYGVPWGPKHPKPSYPKGGDYDPKYPHGKPSSTYPKDTKPTYPAGYPETCDEYGVPWGPKHPKPSSVGYPKGGDYDPKYPHGKPSSVGYPKGTKPTYPAGYPEDCDEYGVPWGPKHPKPSKGYNGDYDSDYETDSGKPNYPVGKPHGGYPSKVPSKTGYPSKGYPTKGHGYGAEESDDSDYESDDDHYHAPGSKPHGHGYKPSKPSYPTATPTPYKGYPSKGYPTKGNGYPTKGHGHGNGWESDDEYVPTKPVKSYKPSYPAKPTYNKPTYNKPTGHGYPSKGHGHGWESDDEYVPSKPSKPVKPYKPSYPTKKPYKPASPTYYKPTKPTGHGYPTKGHGHGYPTKGHGHGNGWESDNEYVPNKPTGKPSYPGKNYPSKGHGHGNGWESDDEETYPKGHGGKHDHEDSEWESDDEETYPKGGKPYGGYPTKSTGYPHGKPSGKPTYPYGKPSGKPSGKPTYDEEDCDENGVPYDHGKPTGGKGYPHGSKDSGYPSKGYPTKETGYPTKSVEYPVEKPTKDTYPKDTAYPKDTYPKDTYPKDAPTKSVDYPHGGKDTYPKTTPTSSYPVKGGEDEEDCDEEEAVPVKKTY